MYVSILEQNVSIKYFFLRLIAVKMEPYILLVHIQILLTVSISIVFVPLLEAALQSCSYKRLFWKYAANLLENTHAEVGFH